MIDCRLRQCRYCNIARFGKLEGVGLSHWEKAMAVESARVRTPPILFGAICFLSAVCGGAAVLGVWLIRANALSLSIFAMQYPFLILLLVGIVSPPAVLLWTRRGQKRIDRLSPKTEPVFLPSDFGMIGGKRAAIAHRASGKDPKGYYACLGVQETASTDEIKAAYRAQVKNFHPDRNPAGDVNAAWFQQINEGYRVLANPEQRVAYDLLHLTRPANALVVVNPKKAEVTFPNARDPTQHQAAVVHAGRNSKIWLLLGSGCAGLIIGCVGVGAFLVTRPNPVPDKKSNSAPELKLCIAPVQGQVEVFSTIPTLQLSKYIDGLRAGTYAFSFRFDGMAAASQLAFSRRFATAYGAVLERAKALIAQKGTATIQDTIALFESILTEERTIDQLLTQRGKHFSSIIFLRALQDGYCGFPNAYADGVPTPDAVLAQVAITFPRIKIDPSDSLFATLYNKQLDRARDQGRQPGGYSFFKTIESLRHEIVLSGP
jgi:curved DNA-binding protein CbpA